MEEDYVPADGAETEDAVKKALWRKAVGYEVQEVVDIDSTKGASTITKNKHIPGDLKALQLYRKLYGDGGI